MLVGVSQQKPGLVVFSVVLFDVFVLTSWQILDPLRRVVLQQDSQVAISRRIYLNSGVQDVEGGCETVAQWWPPGV